MREKRRYFRCAVDTRVIAHQRTEGAWIGHIVNISEGGLCIVAPVPLATRELLEMEFKLPSSSIEISAECEVQSVAQDGRAGLRFIRIRGESKFDLQHWLTVQLNAVLKPTL